MITITFLRQLLHLIHLCDCTASCWFIVELCVHDSFLLGWKTFVHCVGVCPDKAVHNFFVLPNSSSYPNIWVYNINTCMCCIINGLYIVFLVQVRFRTEVPRTQSSTRPGFALMTSKSWQCISYHWDDCSNHSAISDFNTKCTNHKWLGVVFDHNYQQWN